MAPEEAEEDRVEMFEDVCIFLCRDLLVLVYTAVCCRSANLFPSEGDLIQAPRQASLQTSLPSLFLFLIGLFDPEIP